MVELNHTALNPIKKQTRNLTQLNLGPNILPKVKGKKYDNIGNGVFHILKSVCKYDLKQIYNQYLKRPVISYAISRLIWSIASQNTGSSSNAQEITIFVG